MILQKKTISVSFRPFSSILMVDGMVDDLADTISAVKGKKQPWQPWRCHGSPGEGRVHGHRHRPSTTAVGFRKVLYLRFLP